MMQPLKERIHKKALTPGRRLDRVHPWRQIISQYGLRAQDILAFRRLSPQLCPEPFQFRGEYEKNNNDHLRYNCPVFMLASG